MGAIFEIGAILTAAALALLVRKRGATFAWTLGGPVCLATAFASWLIFVAPANAEFVQWLTTPIPADWTYWRKQWEYAHAMNALIKIIGLSLLVISVLIETPDTKAIRKTV